jgi:hypothetical protein
VHRVDQPAGRNAPARGAGLVSRSAQLRAASADAMGRRREGDAAARQSEA